ncbi:hypothetical protein [Promicromonospora sp. NFX87]|uniref:hypothetical protein n=1 Tax=Promicromonospora sp. NFX87 TaxID=3402691 RepID=UPI003AFA0A00
MSSFSARGFRALGLAAVLALLAAACAPSGSEPSPSTSRGGVPTTEPTTGQSGRQKETRSPGPETQTIEVAGPTIAGSYPNHFENLVSPEPDGYGCGGFRFSLTYRVVIVATSTDPPLEVYASDCELDTKEPSAGPCRAGQTLEPGTLCGMRARISAEAATNRDYPRMVQVFRVAVECTDTADPPCDDAAVVAAQPAPSSPVTVHWTRTNVYRYCGATGANYGLPAITGCPPLGSSPTPGDGSTPDDSSSPPPDDDSSPTPDVGTSPAP